MITDIQYDSVPYEDEIGVIDSGVPNGFSFDNDFVYGITVSGEISTVF